jgi:hypothetical protein
VAPASDPGGDGRPRGFFRGLLGELIEHVKHEARLNRLEQDGSEDPRPVRWHLEKLAKKGNKEAIKALDGPEAPEELGYLIDWYWQVVQGLREALTWADVRAWAELTGRRPEPMEAEALMRVDVAMRHPGEAED